VLKEQNGKIFYLYLFIYLFIYDAFNDALCVSGCVLLNHNVISNKFRMNWKGCERYRVSFLGVKRPERDVDHPPLSSAEVKERVKLTSTPPLGLRGLF